MEHGKRSTLPLVGKVQAKGVGRRAEAQRSTEARTAGSTKARLGRVVIASGSERWSTPASEVASRNSIWGALPPEGRWASHRGAGKVQFGFLRAAW